MQDRLVQWTGIVLVSGMIAMGTARAAVYYVDGKDWHGAAHYYEYPCVFAWVLINTYLGVQYALDVDLVIRPRMPHPGRVEVNATRFALAYTLSADSFVIENLSSRERSFRVDLSCVHPHAGQWEIAGQKQASTTGLEIVLRVSPGESATWHTS